MSPLRRAEQAAEAEERERALEAIDAAEDLAGALRFVIGRGLTVPAALLERLEAYEARSTALADAIDTVDRARRASVRELLGEAA